MKPSESLAFTVPHLIEKCCILKNINFNYDLSLLKYFMVYPVFSIFFIVLTIAFTLISWFNLIYPVVDLFSHELLSLDFYQQELINGQFGLRIVSLILGIKTISALLDLVLQKSNIKTGYPELDNLSVNHPISQVTAFVLGQLFIYQLATFSLWISNLFLGSLLETKLISWALFFVVDDWAIISDYYKALKGRFFTSHLVRITFFNVLFCVVLPITFYKYFNWWIALITFVFIAILSTLSLVYIIFKDSWEESVEPSKTQHQHQDPSR